MTILLFILSIEPFEATRILHDEYLVLPSLIRHQSETPSPNPCSNIPNGGGGNCVTDQTITEGNFASHKVMAPPPTTPPPPPTETTGFFHDKKEGSMEELERGKGGTPSPNCCSNIPNRGCGRSCTTTISERNFAGYKVMAPPPPLSRSSKFLQDKEEGLMEQLEESKGATPSPNCCSNIPNGGCGHPCTTSTISERHFAGHAFMDEFQVASSRK